MLKFRTLPIKHTTALSAVATWWPRGGPTQTEQVLF